MTKKQARESAALRLRVYARQNGYYTDQHAWDCCAGYLSSITRADVNAVKRLARAELDGNGEHHIRER